MLRAIIGYPIKWTGFLGMASAVAATGMLADSYNFKLTETFKNELMLLLGYFVATYIVFKVGKWITGAATAKKGKSFKFQLANIFIALGCTIFTLAFVPGLPTLLGFTDNFFANLVGYYGTGWVEFAAFIGALAIPVPGMFALSFWIWVLTLGKVNRDAFVTDFKPCQHCGAYELVDTGKVTWENEYTSGDYHVKEGKDKWECGACGEISRFDYTERSMTAEASARISAERAADRARRDAERAADNARRDAQRAQADLAEAQRDADRSSAADRKRLEETLAKAQRDAKAAQEKAARDAKRDADRAASTRAANDRQAAYFTKSCGTCDRWCGSRSTDHLGHYATFNAGDSGNCTRFNSSRTGGQVCGDYRKWSNLK